MRLRGARGAASASSPSPFASPSRSTFGGARSRCGGFSSLRRGDSEAERFLSLAFGGGDRLPEREEERLYEEDEPERLREEERLRLGMSARSKVTRTLSGRRFAQV